MAAVTPQIAALFRRNRSTVLRAMAAVSQAKIAELMQCSESTVSRMKDEVGDKPSVIDTLSGLLAACNLVVQPVSNRSIAADELAALHVLARKALDTAPASDFGALDDLDRG